MTARMMQSQRRAAMNVRTFFNPSKEGGGSSGVHWQIPEVKLSEVISGSQGYILHHQHEVRSYSIMIHAWMTQICNFYVMGKHVVGSVV